jgi:DNA-binding NarL/FixJ family response regulator
MINILLVDDQALLCEVLKTWLDIEQDLQVVGVAHNGSEAIEQVEKLQPDIVLMDIDMPQMDGLSATKIISQRFPQAKVIFLSGYDDDAYLGKSLQAGAKGYLLKNTTAEELVLKIRSVYNNVNLLNLSQDNQSLEALQNQLEELIETYKQKFKNQVAEYENTLGNSDRFEQIEQKYAQRFHEIEDQLYAKQVKKINDLEYKNQSSWESVRKELINVNGQFNQANRNLNSQFNQQINHLKQDLEEKLSNALEDWSRQRAALQEWAVQRDEMRPSMEEYESRGRHELMTVINPIRASFKDVDKKFKKMRTWTIASSILTLMALTISGYLLFSEGKMGTLPFLPSKDVTN